MGKLYSVLTKIILSIVFVYIFNINVIYESYTLYYSESVWGILIAILEQILYLEFNILEIIIILLIIGFLGGLVSKSYKNAIYSSIFSGIIISITWLILIVRFTPNYWYDNSLGIIFILGSILRGLIISSIFLLPSIIGGFLILKKGKNDKKLKYPKIETICPYCHKKFNSNPIYCCYCNRIIENSKEDQDYRE